MNMNNKPTFMALIFTVFIFCNISNKLLISCNGFATVPEAKNNKAKLTYTINPNQLLRGFPKANKSPLQVNKKDGNELQQEENVELQRYNDDAFGLVFLIGGFASQNVDFAGTFLLLSAMTAIETSRGTLGNDARIPGLVAITSLILAPIITSLRISGSLDMVEIHAPVELLGVCFVSMAVGIYKQKEGRKQ